MKIIYKSVLSAAMAFLSSAASAYTIYPVPHNLQISEKSIELSSTVNLVLSQDLDDATVTRVKEVLEKAGLQYSVSDVRAVALTDILVGIHGSGDMADSFMDTRQMDKSIFPDRDGKHDPYLLAVGSDDDMGTIAITGDENGSAFYALATLEQMLEQRNGAKLQEVEIADYAYVKMRGIVEGFYGHPYSAESRLDMLDFCKRYKLNYYVYAPKHDPYHAGKWRENYPESVTDEQRKLGHLSRNDMQELAAKAKACGVDLVWAVHPALEGGGINFYNLDPGVEDIITKFGYLYDLGVRHFGVSVDDMSGHPSTQGELAAKVQAKLDERYNANAAADEDKVGGILFVPTGYALNYGGASSVLMQFADVDSKINVAFTGYDCFSNVRPQSFALAAEYIGRNPVFWWNNPVNDDYDDFLYMHGLTARWSIENPGEVPYMGGMLLNPMNQAVPSKIAVFNAADYSWNPTAYDEAKSWEASIRSIMCNDEYADALKIFIDMVSAYTTTETGRSDSSRPNGFNSTAKQAPEGEKYAELFTAFRNAYSENNIPDASELKNVLAKAVDACELLHELEFDSDPARYLFYKDMKPWFLKIEEMCHIAYESLKLMDNANESLDNWTVSYGLADRADGYHSRSDFNVSVLCGTASDPNEVFIESLPAPRYFEPFVDFLADEVGKFTPQLPERSRDMMIISNCTDTGSASVEKNGSEVEVKGLDDMVLQPGEYVGIYFNRIKEVVVEPYNCEDVRLQYSVNGKQWLDVDINEAEPVVMAYLRIRNLSGYDVVLPSDRLRCSVDDSDLPESLSPVATTNMGTYMSYNISNILDGDISTFFWSNSAPSAGSYIMVDLGQSVPVDDIMLTFRSGDKPSGEVALQLSDDASSWTTLSTFTSSDIVDEVYSFSADGASTRYVRMLIQSVTTNEWLQIAEFDVAYQTSDHKAREVAEDNNGVSSSALDDRNLSTNYNPESEGYITYTFIENINIEEIHIFNSAKFSDEYELPSVKILAGDEWIDKGVINGDLTVIDTHELSNISQLRIEWNDVNRPVLHQIMPIGTPYVEDKSTVSISQLHKEAPGISIQISKYGLLTVSADDCIAEIVATDIMGREVKRTYPQACRQSLRLHTPGFYIIKVSTVNGETQSFKIAY